MKLLVIGRLVLLMTGVVVISLFFNKITWRENSIIRQGQGHWRSIQSLDITHHKVFYHTQGQELYIHTAFLDDRFNSSAIRVFGLENKGTLKDSFICKWTIQDGGVIVKQEVPAQKYYVDKDWPNWGHYFAVAFNCSIPSGLRLEKFILGTSDGTYQMEIKIERGTVASPRKSVGICVKPITNSFKSSRLVEWIEIQRLAGVDDFLLYNSDITGSAKFVFEYYQQKGLVTMLSFPFLDAVLTKIDSNHLEPDDRYAAYQQIFLIALQDCFYRHREEFEFLAFIDLDEIILPTKPGESLPDMLHRTLKTHTKTAGMLFLTAWHFEEHGIANNDESMSFLYMQKYSKSTFPIDNQPKSVVMTDRVIGVNFHSVVWAHPNWYTNEIIPWEESGYVHHYRGKCKDKFEWKECLQMFNNSRIDPTIGRYAKILVDRVGQIMNHLQVP